MKKYRLKCFLCETKFESKNDVFRNINNFPVCQTCLIEFLEETWEENFVEYIIEKIEKDFNRNYLKWKKWFFDNHMLCDGEDHQYIFFYEAEDMITIIDGKKYCRYCIEKINNTIENKDHK